MTVSGVRSLCGNAKFVNTLWQLAYHGKNDSQAACPVCCKTARLIQLPLGETSLELDICCTCQMIWFDPQELETLPLPQPAPKNELPQKAKEILANYECQRASREITGAWEDVAAPEESWKTLPALFGFPVELDAPEINKRPWSTWSLSAICVIVFAFTFSDLRNVIDNWGLLPADLWRHGGLTLLTSMFLHGGVWHLMGNIYFLLIFGDNVEDALGKMRYILLVLFSGLAGSILFLLFCRNPQIPCVGSSGFISGVIAAYSVCFPKVTISFLLRQRYSFRCHWVGIPAWAAFGLWLVLQTLMAYLTRSNMGGGVGYTAHIGGALAGVAAALVFRLYQKNAAEDFSKKLDDYRSVK